MNKDFSFADDFIYENKKKIGIYRILYKNECIAFFRETDLLVGCSYQELATNYVNVFGYMAEHRRQWNNGNHVDWKETLRVEA